MKTLSEKEFAEIFPLFRRSSDLITELLAVSHYKTFPGDALVYSEGDACSAGYNPPEGSR